MANQWLESMGLLCAYIIKFHPNLITYAADECHSKFWHERTPNFGTLLCSLRSDTLYTKSGWNTDHTLDRSFYFGPQQVRLLIIIVNNCVGSGPNLYGNPASQSRETKGLISIDMVSEKTRDTLTIYKTLMLCLSASQICVRQRTVPIYTRILDAIGSDLATSISKSTNWLTEWIFRPDHQVSTPTQKLVNRSILMYSILKIDDTLFLLGF